MDKRKRLNVGDLNPVAQKAIKVAIHEALAKGYPDLTDDQKTNLYREMSVKDDVYIVDLCTPPENATWDSKEALIVARATVDRYSGEIVGNVEVFLPPVNLNPRTLEPDCR
jgi:hypothetical protein